ncbi:MAG TPA: CARDB domain-containing protein [Polyangia bacterium]|jgi:hypothetical protein|nr:CARDB domain-containing protein [Polyangia bacterium]
MKRPIMVSWKRVALVVTATMLAVACLSQHAVAWTPFYTFNGFPVKWPGGQTIKLDNACTTSDQASAASRARNQWLLTGVNILSSLVLENRQCATHFGDGVNEMAFLPPSQLPDGSLGLTQCRRTSILYLECDILMNNNNLMWLGAVNEATGFPVGRSVIVHEMGHFQGLGHFEGLDQMKSGIPILGPALVGGGTGITTQPPYADDANGVRALYGSPSRTNVFASAQLWSSNFGGQIQVTNAQQVFHICRGSTISSPINYTVVNNGTVHANGIGFSIYLATDPEATGGNEVYNATLNLSAGTSLTDKLNQLTIPTGLPNGTYFIHWKIDANNQLAEYDETDNRVRSALSLNVDC